MIIQFDDLTISSNDIHVDTYDIYKVYSLKNIRNYEYVNFNSWKVETNDELHGDKEDIYLVIDTHYHDAFGHWVFESAIYLPLFFLLKKVHPSIKIWFKSPRNYKKIFCEYFGILPTDYVYSVSLADANLCFFPSPISALNLPELHTDFIKHLNIFWDLFKYTTGTNVYTITVLPRQVKENVKENDRIIPFNILTDYLHLINNSKILHTDTVTQLIEQIETIRKSSIVVVADGAAFQVNGMFCYGKEIIISGPLITEAQSKTYRKLDYIKNKIKEQNKVLHYIEKMEDIKRKCFDAYTN